jgi:DNA-binding NtrC family response regulator
VRAAEWFRGPHYSVTPLGPPSIAEVRGVTDLGIRGVGSERIELTLRQIESALIGRSSAMARLRDEITRVARVPSVVLITGESGTGKELVARELHRFGTNPSAPFVAINCAALPENLVESELFGHERGAYTGAVATRRGAFESAGRGTIFLDEIGEMPMMMQPKLLRVLERRAITRVGANDEIKIAARVVTATHRDLDQMVGDGRFREDLLYRLNVHVLRVPSLRERREDIALLAERFVVESCNDCGFAPKHLTPTALETLASHDWKRNNVRELRNVIERAVVYARGGEIGATELALNPEPRAPSVGFHAQRHDAERRIIVASLEKHRWHITNTAAALDLADHASLLKIMRRLGISNR